MTAKREGRVEAVPDGARQPPPRGGGVNPVEFLRRMLEISPEDAAEAREQAVKDAEGGETGRR